MARTLLLAPFLLLSACASERASVPPTASVTAVQAQSPVSYFWHAGVTTEAAPDAKPFKIGAGDVPLALPGEAWKCGLTAVSATPVGDGGVQRHLVCNDGARRFVSPISCTRFIPTNIFVTSLSMSPVEDKEAITIPSRARRRGRSSPQG